VLALIDATGGETMLTLTEYQQRAHRAADYPAHLALHYLIPGLVAQLHEVGGLLMFYEITPSPARRREIIEEYGVCVWFIAEICTVLDIDLMLVAVDKGEEEELSLEASSMAVLQIWLEAIKQTEGDLDTHLRATQQQEQFRYLLLDMLNEINTICRTYLKSKLDEVLRTNLKVIKQ
jgi:hypothetical protein